MRMAGNKRDREIGGDESVKQCCKGSADSHHHRQRRRRGKRRKGRCTPAQPDQGQHGNSDRHDEGHDQCEVAKFGDHRKSSLDMFCIGANKYHGGLISQTTRDISLTLVDGTHSYLVKRCATRAPPDMWHCVTIPLWYMPLPGLSARYGGPVSMAEFPAGIK